VSQESLEKVFPPNLKLAISCYSAPLFLTLFVRENMEVSQSNSDTPRCRGCPRVSSRCRSCPRASSRCGCCPLSEPHSRVSTGVEWVGCSRRGCSAACPEPRQRPPGRRCRVVPGDPQRPHPEIAKPHEYEGEQLTGILRAATNRETCTPGETYCDCKPIEPLLHHRLR